MGAILPEIKYDGDQVQLGVDGTVGGVVHQHLVVKSRAPAVPNGEGHAGTRPEGGGLLGNHPVHRNQTTAWFTLRWL